ncbi:MAG: prolyl oligopeptidase family serine peptidase [Gammaproteobacteria bacterium]|nr:MAG: prolyl oligopeptidase family serine peptidase [Gammaproteobacteria bacterium]
MRWKRIIRTVLITLALLVVGLATTVVLYLRLPWIRTESVHFRNGDVTLAGTLALPRWRDGPYPAAVVVQGSGTFSRWVYWMYARRLVPYGMAVLIYDKRGVGKSTGTYLQGTTWNAESIANCGQMFSLLAGDALAGIEALKVRDDIDSRRMGFVGVSQAGWIMPLAASRSADVAFIVNISGPAVTCGMEDWYSQLTGEYRAYPEAHAPAAFADGELSDEEIERRLDEYQGPQGYDPVPILGTLRVPTLWVLGGRDRSVPTSRSVANLNRLIAAGAPFDVKIYPEGDHSLFRRYPGDPSFAMSMKLMFRHIDYWSDVRAWLAGKGMLP